MVSPFSPDGRLLVKEVNLTLAPGENLFVTGSQRRRQDVFVQGPGGSLGTNRRDHHRPDVAGATDESFQVFYVPQKPYLVSGTLRDR